MIARSSILVAFGFVASLAGQDRAPIVPSEFYPEVEWDELGPAPITSGPYTGRVSSVVCSRTSPTRYYVGGADGGVWRTDNGGARWIPVGDGLPTTAIGALAIDPGDDDVIYAGMGESNFANHSRYGMGFARSRDAGQTWSVFGEAVFSGRCFSRIRVDPQSPAIIYASTTHAGGFPAKAAARSHPSADGSIGIFKSTDFGKSWAQLTNGIPTNLSATDVALDPQNPNNVYAAIGDIFGSANNGVYKSTNGGASFTKLGGGLPTSSVGRIGLAIAPSQPSTMIASVVNASSSTGGNASTRNLYRSTNSGASWSAISPGSYHATYGWYLDTSIFHPTNPNTIFAGGFDLRRTTNGGNSWQTVTPPHVDLHALDWDVKGRLLCGNDGGVHITANSGNSWSSLNNNLGLIQFYAGISIDPTDPARFYGGVQDNGSIQRASGTSWNSVLGGDGGYTSIDSTGNRVFVEFQGTGNLYRSLNGGSFQFSGSGLAGRNCFLPPHEIHPLDPLLMIYGAERLFVSTNGGSSWSARGSDLTAGGSAAAISGLAFAPSDENTIYALTNDGRVQVSADQGNNWLLSLTGIETWPRTRRPFAVHPTDPQKAYMAVAGFGGAKLLGTEDGGVTWTNMTGSLPDIPANAVAIHVQPNAGPVLYLGTDRGVWRSDDLGGGWWRYGATLPNAPVIDLRVDAKNERVVAATQGRGLWTATLLPRRAARATQGTTK